MRISYALTGDRTVPAMNGIMIKCHTHKCTRVVTLKNFTEGQIVERTDYLLGFEEKLIFFRFGRLTCEILDQSNKDDFIRKYIRKDIKHKLTSFRIMFILQEMIDEKGVCPYEILQANGCGMGNIGA